LALAAAILLIGAGPRAAESADEKGPAANAEQQERRFRDFQQRLHNVRLVGQFSVVGKEGPLAKEEYAIHRVEKMSRGDYWLFHTRLRYGKIDVRVPLPLEVKWAGDTPVITLTDLTIPALGTFSSRVVIDKDKYAGTWTHGKATGHLFGVIESIEATQEPVDEEKSRSEL